MTKVEYNAKGSSITCPSQKHRLPDKITAKISSSKLSKQCDTSLSAKQYNTTMAQKMP
jgi:hypothetical protein